MSLLHTPARSRSTKRAARRVCAVQNITIANGAGAFKIGGVAGTDAITLGVGSVDVFTWTNNSANTATIENDVNLAFGGGDNDNTLTLTGSGNWLFNANFGNLGTGSMLSTTKAAPAP